MVNGRWGLVTQVLMGPFVVVELEVIRQARDQIRDSSILFEVDIFVFHRPPQPLHKDVVEDASTPIHGDLDLGTFQLASKTASRKLDALVSVEDVGSPAVQSLPEGIETKEAIQSIGQLPGQHIARLPIHHGDQIHKPVRHRYVGNVGRPNLVRSLNLEPTQQIGVFLVLLIWNGGPWAWIDGLQTHFPHQTGHPLRVDLDAEPFAEPDRHFPIAIKRGSRVFLVNPVHQLHVEGAFFGRLPIVAGPAQPDQVALAADTQSGMVGVDQHALTPTRTG